MAGSAQSALLPRVAGEESRLRDPCQTAEISMKGRTGFRACLAGDRELLSEARDALERNRFTGAATFVAFYYAIADRLPQYDTHP